MTLNSKTRQDGMGWHYLCDICAYRVEFTSGIRTAAGASAGEEGVFLGGGFHIFCLMKKLLSIVR